MKFEKGKVEDLNSLFSKDYFETLLTETNTTIETKVADVIFNDEDIELSISIVSCYTTFYISENL